jgi:hypothetical protein
VAGWSFCMVARHLHSTVSTSSFNDHKRQTGENQMEISSGFSVHLRRGCIIIFINGPEKVSLKWWIRQLHFEWGRKKNMTSSPEILVTFYKTTLFRQSQWPCGLRHKPWSLKHWDHGFESNLRHVCLSSYIHHQSLVTLLSTLYSLDSENTS